MTTVKDIELAFVQRRVDIGPYRIRNTDLSWEYKHMPYYEDRYVRVYFRNYGRIKLDYCDANVRELVVADILRRYPHFFKRELA